MVRQTGRDKYIQVPLWSNSYNRTANFLRIGFTVTKRIGVDFTYVKFLFSEQVICKLEPLTYGSFERNFALLHNSKWLFFRIPKAHWLAITSYRIRLPQHVVYKFLVIVSNLVRITDKICRDDVIMPLVGKSYIYSMIDFNSC